PSPQLTCQHRAAGACPTHRWIICYASRRKVLSGGIVPYLHRASRVGHCEYSVAVTHPSPREMYRDSSRPDYEAAANRPITPVLTKASGNNLRSLEHSYDRRQQAANASHTRFQRRLASRDSQRERYPVEMPTTHDLPLVEDKTA